MSWMSYVTTHTLVGADPRVWVESGPQLPVALHGKTKFVMLTGCIVLTTPVPSRAPLPGVTGVAPLMKIAKPTAFLSVGHVVHVYVPDTVSTPLPVSKDATIDAGKAVSS